ncbi:MAG TPA: protein kinase [bacterium]|nr:protein kinase [bacterium]
MSEALESGFYGQYQLVEKIASGGMAEVFKAKYRTFGDIEKTVIVKRILPQYTNDDEFTKMFVDEARISMALQHVNLVHTFDFGQIDGAYYLAMEYVEGADLQSILRECHFRRIPIPMELSVLLVAEVLRGLDYAHRRVDPSTGKKMGIVHRDISPANIMISYAGNVKVMDFGIAKAKTKSSTTQIGTLKGKYSYMSPEQARGDDVDFRSDVFSCGIILYELVTGVRPFRGKAELEILERVKAAKYDPPRNVNPHIPARLAEIIDISLAADREKRFSETQLFCDRLNAVMSEFEERPDSAKLARFLRKVFAEDGKKNRTDLSALVEKAVEQEAKEQSRSKSQEKARSGEKSPDKPSRDSIAPAKERTATEQMDKASSPNVTQRLPAKSRVSSDDLASRERERDDRADRDRERAARARRDDDVDPEEERSGEVPASEPDGDAAPIEFAVAAISLRAEDGEDAEQHIREFLAVVEDEVANRGGRVEKRTDAGLIAYFDADVGSEVDHRLRAVETARKAVDLARRPGNDVTLTAGVCAGSVDRGVTQASVKAMTGAIKRAERLASRADGVGVLVDEDVANNVGDGYVLRRVGESDGAPAFAPVRAAAKDRSTRSKMVGRTVGREAEQKRLTQRLDEVIGGAGARSVAIVGAPGIGKSHLVHELLRAAATKGAAVVVGRCVAAGRHVPFQVFNDIIRDLLGLPDGAGRDATAQRLERVVTELNLASSIPGTLKPLYAGARSLTPEQISAIAAALREILGGMAANNKSIVMVVEDLHFADEASRAVVASLIDLLRRERVLVVVTARADVDDQWVKARKGIDEVRLGLLDDRSILQIAMDRMQLPALSPELSDFLRGKAKGNPFYLLETVRRLNEKGLGGAAATNRTNLTAQGDNNEMYSPVIAKPKILSDKQRESVQRAKQAVAPQVRGFADDIRRAVSFIRPYIHKLLDGGKDAVQTAKKVKKAYDPKTAETLKDELKDDEER